MTLSSGFQVVLSTFFRSYINPFKYLEYIFEKLSQDADYDFEQLMPWAEDVKRICSVATNQS